MTSHVPGAGVDPRSPLVLDTHDLGRRAGAMREVATSVPAPSGLGGPMIGVPVDSPITLALRLESVSEGVLVTGTAVVDLAGECSRCLDPISEHLEVELQELWLYPDTHPDVDPEDEDLSRLDGELLDLEPALRDAIVLDLPFSPLCRDDCAGLCPECGTNLNDHPDHTHGDPIDARWQGLGDWAAD